MAIGITVQKNYVSSSLTSNNLTNNWMVLVLGITKQGPVTPTLVQTYADFTSIFGQPVENTPTHPYVQFLLNSKVPVLFKRVINSAEMKTASIEVKNLSETPLFSATAVSDYNGSVGNNIYVTITKTNEKSGSITTGITNAGNIEMPITKTFFATTLSSDTFESLLLESIKRGSLNNKYVNFTLLDETLDDWNNVFTGTQTYNLTGGSTPTNDLDAAINILKDPENTFWNDSKLKNAILYYPQLRFITSGGIISSDKETQDTINHNLGLFAVNCENSFRVLVDYSLDEVDISVVRDFANAEAASGDVSPAVYAYYGYWGADSNGNWLPGSAGFLSALGLAGYNVYSRRIAGSSFTPAFTKSYENIYIDALTNWQSATDVQLNPIVVIDAQNNLAVMGSSTLALPLSSTSAKNPAQALDVILVGDYIAAILHSIALGELDSALDRLSLNSLSNRMSQEVERFVTSRAITKYNFDFDTTQLGKLGITCTLYFAVGLEEVSLTISSVYDTAAI